MDVTSTEVVAMKTQVARLMLALLPLAAPLAAQRTADSLLVPGVRARVTSIGQGAPTVVYIRRVTPDSLYVQLPGATDGAPAPIARGTIERLEFSTGRHTPAIAKVLPAVGAIGGAVAGGAMAHNAWTPCTDTRFMGCLFHPDRDVVTGVGAIAGLLVGGVLGGIALLASTQERWVDVPLDSLRAAP